MIGKKGFTLVELIVSFVLITVISIGFFRTTLSLQQNQQRNIARNKYKSFNVVVSNAIQSDFLNDKIEKIVSCGDNCYDITYSKNGVKRIDVDTSNNIITYGSVKEKLPSDYEFVGNIEFTQFTSSEEGNNSYILLTINVKSNLESKMENIKYMYQYDSNEATIDLS